MRKLHSDETCYLFNYQFCPAAKRLAMQCLFVISLAFPIMSPPRASSSREPRPRELQENRRRRCLGGSAVHVVVCSLSNTRQERCLFSVNSPVRRQQTAPGFLFTQSLPKLHNSGQILFLFSVLHKKVPFFLNVSLDFVTHRLDCTFT